MIPFPAEDLLSHLEPLVRVRGYRLYTQKGRRLLDLYQGEGRWLLGHRLESRMHKIKNHLSKGPEFPCPSPWNRRFHQLLEAFVQGWIPGYPHYALYRNEDRALLALERAGLDFVVWRPFDPDFGAESLEALPLGARPQVLLPRLSLGSSGPVVLLFADNPLPGDGLINPLEAAGAVAALSELSRLLEEARGGREAQGSQGPRDQQGPRGTKGRKRPAPGTLWHEESWQLWNPAGFQRKGPWLWPLKQDEQRFSFFLEAGFLLPPDYRAPALIPRIHSPGERAAFHKRAQEWAGGISQEV